VIKLKRVVGCEDSPHAHVPYLTALFFYAKGVSVGKTQREMTYVAQTDSVKEACR
jgi:hypothetical protein